MSVNFYSSANVAGQFPIDPRAVVNGRNTLDPYTVYEGMVIYDTSDNQHYYLRTSAAEVLSRGSLQDSDWDHLDDYDFLQNAPIDRTRARTDIAILGSRTNVVPEGTVFSTIYLDSAFDSGARFTSFSFTSSGTTLSGTNFTGIRFSAGAFSNLNADVTYTFGTSVRIDDAFDATGLMARVWTQLQALDTGDIVFGRPGGNAFSVNGFISNTANGFKSGAITLLYAGGSFGVGVNQTAAGQEHPVTFSFDPDSNDDVYAASVLATGTIPGSNVNANDALLFIGNTIAGIHADITYDGMVHTGENIPGTSTPAHFINIALGVLTPLNTSLSFTATGNSTNLNFSDVVSVSDANATSIAIYDYTGAEVSSLSFSVLSAADNNVDEVGEAIANVVNNNIETPVDFTAVYSSEGSTITLLGNPGAIRGEWRIEVDNGEVSTPGNAGNITFAEPVTNLDVVNSIPNLMVEGDVVINGDIPTSFPSDNPGQVWSRRGVLVVGNSFPGVANDAPVTFTGSDGITITGGETLSGLPGFSLNHNLPLSLNIDLDDTAVTPGTYNLATITVDQQGRITAASSGTDSDTMPNDATITLTAGTGLSGGGDFTTNQSSAEELTFNIDSSVVTLTGTQTLTNKSIDAGQLTGTIADARLSSNIVTTTGTQTLTNKSIDAGQLTGTIADARIPSTIARDSELSDFITADSTDTLTNKSIDAGQLTGTIDDARIPSSLTRDTELTAGLAGKLNKPSGNPLLNSVVQVTPDGTVSYIGTSQGGDFRNLTTHSLQDWPTDTSILPTGNVLINDNQLNVSGNIVEEAYYHADTRVLVLDFVSGFTLPPDRAILAKYSGTGSSASLLWYGKVIGRNEISGIIRVAVIFGHDYISTEGNSSTNPDGTLGFVDESQRLYLLQYLYRTQPFSNVGVLELDDNHDPVVRPIQDNTTASTGDRLHIPTVGRVEELIGNSPNSLAVAVRGTRQIVATSEINFNTGLRTSISDTVATVNVMSIPMNIQANLPGTISEALTGFSNTMYRGRYTLTNPTERAPRVILYGQEAVTIPAVLPSTVGTHDFTMYWTQQVRNSIIDNNSPTTNPIYGQLVLDVIDGEFDFTDDYVASDGADGLFSEVLLTGGFLLTRDSSMDQIGRRAYTGPFGGRVSNTYWFGTGNTSADGTGTEVRQAWWNHGTNNGPDAFIIGFRNRII